MSAEFRYALDDITAWIIKRKDGTTTRFNVVQKGKDGSIVRPNSSLSDNRPQGSKVGIATVGNFWGPSKGYSDWCNHTPSIKNPPIFSDGKVNLYIADAAGARASHGEFDVCIDGGNILTIPGEYDLPNLYGDPSLSRKLSQYSYKPKSESKPGPRILKIRWADRCAPPVYPKFWPALNEELHKLSDELKRPVNVLTICMGGHGRSGSALVCLLMCMTDYTPLDALTHIRALHCARAIESKDQHIYLNLVGEVLGREQNALEAENVKSFKDRFLALESSTAQPYKERVKGGKGAIVAEREGSYL